MLYTHSFGYYSISFSDGLNAVEDILSILYVEHATVHDCDVAKSEGLIYK